MAYKKPQIVAKSAAKQTFVAGCPPQKVHNGGLCSMYNRECLAGSVK